MSKKKSASLTLQNLYTHRTATSERPCFVCGKFTSAVLTTGDGLDWFYTCVSHLSDRGFASLVPESEPEPIKATDPIPTSKKDDGKEKEEKRKVEDNETVEGENKKNKEAKPPSLPPKPKQYILHRDIFYLRESDLKKKRQEKEANNVLRQLPSVPK